MSYKASSARCNTTLTLTPREQVVVSRLTELLGVKTETNVYRRAMRAFLESHHPELAADGLFEDRYMVFVRVYRQDMDRIIQRHIEGESISEIAQTYKASAHGLGVAITRHLQATGRRRATVIRDVRRERCKRFIAADIGSRRVREIAAAIAESETYVEAAAKVGTSRQRIEQVLRVVMMWCAGREAGLETAIAAGIELRQV